MKDILAHGYIVCLGLAVTIFVLVVRVKEAPAMRNAIMPAEIDHRAQKLPSLQPLETCCPVVELRQYTLHPGKRDVLIDLFDREFVESQEALRMTVIGQFRDLDNPDRFVWLRGFPNMPSRAQSLSEFYGGPVWKAHSREANATMIDSDNVLLLRPAFPGSTFILKSGDRPKPDTKELPRGLVIATLYYFNAPVSKDFVDYFERTVNPVVTDSGGSVLASFVSENSANNFPALPVREGEHVFVWFTRFADQAAYERHAEALSRSTVLFRRVRNI